MSAYELSPEAFDGRTFDIVFAGSLTSHLRDPILAFERMRSVTKGKCIVIAPTFDIPAVADTPMMSLVGTMDSDRRSWWVMNKKCLQEMLLCGGFTRVEFLPDLVISNKRLPDMQVTHLVAHAYVD